MQRLVAVLNAVTSLAARDRVEHRDRILHLADLVGAAVGFSTEELAVRFAALDWAEPASVLGTIGRRLDEHALLAPQVMARLAQALERDRAAWAETDVRDAVDVMLVQPSPGTGALAVQLVQTAGIRSGWSAEWRGRLRALRGHTDHDVAILARMVHTAAE